MIETEKISSRTNEIWIEVFNALTHGAAAVLGIFGLIMLIQKALNTSIVTNAEITAYIIYGISLIALFFSSTLYHALSFTPFKLILQKLDHASIYLLIAGSYTPYLIISIGGTFGYVFLAIIWIIALAGIVFEVGWTNKYPKLSTILYLVMGWMGLLILYPLYQSLDINGILLLFFGGVIYSAGTFFYRMKDNGWMHVIWHLFVVGGAALMFFSIYLYV